MVNSEEKKDQDKKAFAVIETGGKQYRVSEGDIITVEKLEGEHKSGDKIVFDSVLLIDNGEDVSLGEPYLDKHKVTGEFIEEGKGKKVSVMRYRSKSRYFKNKGHRQPYNKVKIVSIE